MKNNRWCANRAGLLNFWYYDEEEFHFSDGKLLLRGSNGSGKSVTMQSFIPLLLDGNKSPERLDPFGSKARKLENYLLGEDNEEREESTAYLFIEFIKENSGNYLTIGMGFKAQRGKPLKSWGFAITDSRRIGRDFFLYKDVGDRIPLTKKELENRIGSGGMVKEGQGEYMKMINDLLFGFEGLEEYDEMIKLLIQLRTPKLSKDFKPTVVYEIMENSLQQLSEDDLRPMSEAIENMDNLKSRLEELKESKKASEKIKDAYDKYNRFMLHDRARVYTASYKEHESLLTEKEQLENKREEAKTQHELATKRVEELKTHQKLVEERKKQLDVHDSLKIKQRIYEMEKNNTADKQEQEKKTSQLESKKTRERELYSKIKEYQEKQAKEKNKIYALLQDMENLSLEFAFDEQGFMRAELERDITKKYNFQYIKNDLKNHIKNLNTSKNLLAEQQRCNENYDKTLMNLETAKKNKNHKQKRQEECELLFLETKEELIERIYDWRKTNKELNISDDTMVSLSRKIQNFQERDSFDDIISIVRESLSEIEGQFNKELSSLEFKKDQLNDEKYKIEQQIHELKKMKDIEPERTEKVLSHRKRLVQENIPHLPFYKAVDFKDDLPEKIKGRIEEALIDMGLLDALIIPEKYKSSWLLMEPEMADRYINSSPNLLTHNLSEFLKLEKIEVPGISYEDIDNAVKSIFLDDSNHVYINEKGEYSLGILKGKTTNKYNQRFIGTTARERFRQEKIKALNEDLMQIEQMRNDVISCMEEVNKKVKMLQSEFMSFPKDNDLKVAINELAEAKFNYIKANEEVQRIEAEERRLYTVLKELKLKVYEFTSKINLKASLEVYEEALQASVEYQDYLYDLVNLNEGLARDVEIKNSLEEERENIEYDIENLLGDIGRLSKELLESEALIKSLEEQLNISNYAEVQKEIEDCLRLMDEIPVLLEAEIERKTKQESEYNTSSEKIVTLQQVIGLKKRIFDVNQKNFIDEFNLKYLNLKDLNNDYKNASMVLREVNVQEKQDKDYYSQQLFEKFTINTQYLREYLLRVDNIFERNEEDISQEVTEALSRGKRLAIKGKVRGKDVDFYKILDFIEDGINENERLLRESDRQLFEDILVNTISKKIRSKIYHSEKWVNRMNDLMENMNTSSGLSFSLKWTSKKAESEGQLDTKELVELLKQEGSLMKESDLNKLSEHFRSKIFEARRLQEDNGRSQSFHSIMQEILDYRKWFEFKLFFVKTGQAKKELTNNAFYQFSGGEKAMAMYVPLFSAVYARYEGARKDCPRLISLDEAFAGVDEKNIRDMFRLLNELNLDYIINSQILWGDYDTVPSLAISELIRPDNANFVTVIRYHWNGKIKELVG